MTHKQAEDFERGHKQYYRIYDGYELQSSSNTDRTSSCSTAYTWHRHAILFLSNLGATLGVTEWSRYGQVVPFLVHLRVMQPHGDLVTQGLVHPMSYCQ